MLTRRNAILSSAAVAVNAAFSRSDAGQNLDIVIPKIDQGQTDEFLPFSKEHAAYECLQCAESASLCMTSAASSLDYQASGFVEVCRDTNDICMVTVTLLNRQTPLSPAICQACADACERLISACENVQLGGLESTCMTLASRCASVCRSLVHSVDNA